MLEVVKFLGLKRMVLVTALAAMMLAYPTVAQAATLYTYAGASGYASISSVDNSGFSRSLTMSQTLCKDSTTVGRVIKYKMDFGPTTSTSWHDGVSRGFSSGCSSGSPSDTYYYPNSARGVWVKICINYPLSPDTCGSSKYLYV